MVLLCDEAQGRIYTFSALGGLPVGSLARGVGKKFNASVANKYSPTPAKIFEKWYILLIKEGVFVIRIE